MILLLSIWMIASCATSRSDDNPYNRGVAAYKAKNFAVARKEWSTAAAQGSHTAENNLAYLLYEGLGGAAESERAVALWRQAATAGESEAQWHLGQAYLAGKGVSKDTARAYAWFRCAISTAELPGAMDPNTEDQISRDAHRSLDQLLGSLSTEDFERGEGQAKEYISVYSHRPAP